MIFLIFEIHITLKKLICQILKSRFIPLLTPKLTMNYRTYHDLHMLVSVNIIPSAIAQRSRLEVRQRKQDKVLPGKDKLSTMSLIC
jgi:hypothetical protein